MDNVRRTIAELENNGFYEWENGYYMRECGKFNLERCVVNIDDMEPTDDKVWIHVPIACISEFFGERKEVSHD